MDQNDLRESYSLIRTVKILFNARAFIINNAFSIEGDGRLLEATLFGNAQEKNGHVCYLTYMV